MLSLRSSRVFKKCSKNLINLHSNSTELFFKNNIFPSILHNKFSDTPKKNESDEVPRTMSSRYEIFSEQTSPIILDIEEERQKIETPFEEKPYDEFQGINLTRGKNGVFEVEEVVDILRREKGQDIFVTTVSAEHNYVDFLVLVTGRSSRHMVAMCELIRKIFKMKMNHHDVLPMIEGKNSKDWIALDLGNIALHVLDKKKRINLDLETLWCLGKEFDSKLRGKDTYTDKITVDYSKILAELSPDSVEKN